MVKIIKVLNWDLTYDCAMATISKEHKNKFPSNKWIAQACLAEHSMIREVRYIVEMTDIPCWVSQHIARHDSFPEHTVRESKETHYVGTSRTDITGIDRNKLPQDAPVSHRISLSAQDFITISTKRLCNMASAETKDLWIEVIMALGEIEPILARKCVPTCLYRGFCPEFKGCGYDKSKHFQQELEEYRKTEINNN